MNIQKLEKLARCMVGRTIKINIGNGGSFTDGFTITLTDFRSVFPKLPVAAVADMEEFVVGHEAGHIVEFDKMARKAGKASVSAEEFYQIFADPLSPGADSRGFVRYLLNVVEDQLVDLHSARAVGQDKMNRVNRFFVWNRQGGRRPSMAELEVGGNPGKCAAFVEALFQLAIYGELVESFYSAALSSAATVAAKAMASFGQGSLSRTQALQAVLDALRKYCPPPWKLPAQYQPPKGEGAGQGGNTTPHSSNGQHCGQGQAQGESQGEGSGSESEGGPVDAGKKSSGKKGQKSDQVSKEKGEAGQEKNPSEGSESNDPEGGDSDGKESSEDSDAEASDESQEANAEESDGEDDPEPGSESSGSGNGSPSESNSRGTGTGDGAGNPRIVESATERRFEDNNLDALLRMLERVLAERAKEPGRGFPRWRQWAPGDQVSSSDEICRYEEDETFGVDPLKRRCVRQRTKEQHLLAVFIDSSGSVNDELFGQLYRVLAELAEKIAETSGTMLGVGQFSGGAAWMLEPTDDAVKIQALAEEPAKRLFNGNTVVGEIYKYLPEHFSGFDTADLIVLTDGYVEDGKVLATSLEAAHEATGCEIKLHGVVFRGKGVLKQFSRAKDELPEFVRTWNLGGE